MSVPVLAALTSSLLAVALAIAAGDSLRSHRRTRELIAFYGKTLNAKNEQIAAYERLITAQDALLEARAQTIQIHEERAALFELVPYAPNSAGSSERTGAPEPGRVAYEARFADAPPRCAEPWDGLTSAVKAIWARVEMACRSPVAVRVPAPSEISEDTGART